MSRYISKALLLIGILTVFLSMHTLLSACGDDDDNDDDEDDDTGDDDTGDDDTGDDDTGDDDTGDDDTGDDDDVPSCTFLNAELNGAWFYSAATDDDPPEVIEADAVISQIAGECSFTFAADEIELYLWGEIVGFDVTASFDDQGTGEYIHMLGTINSEGTYIEGTIDAWTGGESRTGTFTLEKQ